MRDPTDRWCVLLGVDDTVTVILRYPGGLQASFSCSITTELSNTLSVFGTKGKVEVRGPWPEGHPGPGTRGARCTGDPLPVATLSSQIPPTMWSPTELVVNGVSSKFPLPKVADSETFNFVNSIGLVYEAQHVRQCLLQGELGKPLGGKGRGLLLLEHAGRARLALLMILHSPGLKESPVMPLAESELLADILEEVRRQIGLRFLQDRM